MPFIGKSNDMTFVVLLKPASPLNSTRSMIAKYVLKNVGFYNIRIYVLLVCNR